MRRMICTATLLALVATACAPADPEPELRASLGAAAVRTIADVSNEEAACISDELLTDVGIEALQTAGLTADALDQAPDTLRSAGGADVDRAIISCVSLVSRLAERTSSEGLRSLEIDCVEPASLEPDALAMALVDGLALFGSESPAGVSDALTDAVRGCVDDTDFARIAGLDSPAELAETLIGDPFSTTDEQDRCVVEAVVGTIGIEQLATLGVTVESPDFLEVSRDIDDELRVDLVGSVADCDLVELLTTHLAADEKQMAACTVSGIDPEAILELAELRFQNQSIQMRPVVRSSFQDCVDARLDDLFGPAPETVDVNVQQFLLGFFQGLTEGVEVNDFERACVVRGLQTALETDQVADVDGAFLRLEQNAGSQADLDLIDAVIYSSLEVVDQCVDPWKRLRAEMTLNGVKDETVTCIEVAAPDIAAALTEASIGALTGDIDASFRTLDLMESLGEELEGCGSATEIAAWDAYLASFAEGLGPIEA